LSVVRWRGLLKVFFVQSSVSDAELYSHRPPNIQLSISTNRTGLIESAAMHRRSFGWNHLVVAGQH